MSMIRRISQKIRHLPGLEQADPVWRVLRRPYHRLLNLGGRGVKVMVGGKSAVWMPAELAGGSWERYEPEAVAVYSDWVRRHPGGVVAFDSDLSSLAATRRVYQHAPGARLRLVHGLLAKTPTDASCLASAVNATEAALLRTGARGDVGTTRYICMTDTNIESIPVRRLDDLFTADIVTGRAMLIKCDVEGAELLVLLGAKALLQRERPDLLLSVHPPALPSYGHSTEGVRVFLEGLGYETRCIAVDHEEHWWCKFKCLG